jgi:hypothetical protein
MNDIHLFFYSESSDTIHSSYCIYIRVYSIILYIGFSHLYLTKQLSSRKPVNLLYVARDSLIFCESESSKRNNNSQYRTTCTCWSFMQDTSLSTFMKEAAILQYLFFIQILFGMYVSSCKKGEDWLLLYVDFSSLRPQG